MEAAFNHLATETSARLPMTQAPVESPNQRTQDPIVTGSSVIAVKYRDGVMMAADTLASYGSMARFKDVQRMIAVNNNTLIGASGEYSDFQQIKKTVEQLVVQDLTFDDGMSLSAKSVHSYLSRIMYNRRSRVNPLWNQLLVAGVQKDGTQFLGMTDLYGSSFEEDFLASGFGNHLAIPILRNEWRADMSEDEARRLIESCLTVLFYRDCRTINKVQLSKVTAQGVSISPPYSLATQWEFSQFVRGGGH